MPKIAASTVRTMACRQAGGFHAGACFVAAHRCRAAGRHASLDTGNGLRERHGRRNKAPRRHCRGRCQMGAGLLPRRRRALPDVYTSLPPADSEEDAAAPGRLPKAAADVSNARPRKPRHKVKPAFCISPVSQQHLVSLRLMRDVARAQGAGRDSRRRCRAKTSRFQPSRRVYILETWPATAGI